MKRLIGLFLFFVLIGEPVVMAQPKEVKKDVPKHGRGFKLPSKEVSAQRHRASNAKHGDILKALPKATQAAYDARSIGVIPPVGDQGQCGDCYLWSGCKSGASAQMVAGIVPRDGKFMLAVSFMLDCHPELGGCNGGDEYQVSQLILSSGCPSLSQYGGDGQTPGQCKPTTGMTLYLLTSIAYCDPTQTDQGVASTQSIKNSILAYGYVSVAGAAGSWTDPGTGTITGNDTSIDHAIGLIGWDDNHDNGDGSKGAWIMQNNWSEQWGNQGYAWIAYGADSIGTEAYVSIAGSGPAPPNPPGPGPSPSTNPATQVVITFQDGTTQTLTSVPTPTGKTYNVTVNLDGTILLTPVQSRSVPSKGDPKLPDPKPIPSVDGVKKLGMGIQRFSDSMVVLSRDFDRYREEWKDVDLMIRNRYHLR